MARGLQIHLKSYYPGRSGYLPLESDAAHLMFQLVSRRYERGSLLVTSNLTTSEWDSVFGYPVVATAILDRLLHP